MAVPLELAYNAVASPKLLILAGTDAVSGACSPVLRRSTAASSDGLRPICTYPETRCIRSFIHGIVSLLGRFP